MTRRQLLATAFAGVLPLKKATPKRRYINRGCRVGKTETCSAVSRDLNYQTWKRVRLGHAYGMGPKEFKAMMERERA